MTTLRVHSCHCRVMTLGPSPAAALWVMGRRLVCRECSSPDTWDSQGGAEVEVEEVARWLLGTGRDRFTLSGGEPMDQAPALVELDDRVRAERDWLVTCYSGCRLEQLRDECLE